MPRVRPGVQELAPAKKDSDRTLKGRGADPSPAVYWPFLNRTYDTELTCLRQARVYVRINLASTYKRLAYCAWHTHNQHSVLSIIPALIS